MGQGVLEAIEVRRDGAQFLCNAVAAGRLDARTDVNDAQAFQLFRVRAGKGHAVATTHRMSEQDELVQTNGVHEAQQVGHECLGGVVTTGCVIGVAAPALVQGIDVVIGAQGFGDVGPDVGVAAEPVEEYQRRLALGSPVEVMQVDSVCGDGSALGLHLRGHVNPP